MAEEAGVVARQVDVVGHSMGGLVARWFLDKTLASSGEGEYLIDPVHKLITVGTPHDGSELANALLSFQNNTPSPEMRGLFAMAICKSQNIDLANCSLKTVF